MRFWDSSALVPLFVVEAQTGAMLELLNVDSEIIVWWFTPIEILAALSRCEREGNLSDLQLAKARDALRALADEWREITPSESVRHHAQRLVRVHPLRAAYSLQLAAAIVACGIDPASLDFVCLDKRLAAIARREGFRVELGEA